MRVTFKQTNGHNCGLYAIANAMNDSSIITDERLADGHKGQTLFLLNKYLSEDGKEFHLETLYKSMFNTKLPLEVDAYPSNPEQVLPLLATVQLRDGGVNHMITLRVFSNKIIQVFDSLKEDVFEINNFQQLHDTYPVIFGVYAICDNDPTKEGYMMLSNS